MSRWFLGVFYILFQYSVAYSVAYGAEATFGPEFNFTNDFLRAEGMKLGGSIVNSPANEAAQKQFLAEVRKKCPDCKAKRIEDKFGIDAFKILTPQGWSFTITLDPWVVEVITSPMTAREAARNAPLMQSLIFDVANSIGLRSQEGGGHLHLGITSAFERDPKKVRNFIVDWTNHSVVMAEAFRASYANASPMEFIRISDSESVLDRFKKEIAEWDGEYRDHLKFLGPETMLSNLIESIEKNVYIKTYGGFDPPEKYQNLNVSHILDFPKEEQTVELRAVREFQSADEFVSFLRIMQGRVDYLSHVDIMIPVESVLENNRNKYLVFDTYVFQAKGDLEFARKKSTFGLMTSPIRLTCEGMF